MVFPAHLGWRGWCWPVLLAGMIVYASGTGNVAGPRIIGFDKVAHFFVFGLLATLVVRNGFARRRAWLAIVIVSAFGASDEWHQSFTPGRTMQVADWVADTLGAIVAVAVYTRWTGYQRWLEAPLRRLGKSRIEKSSQLSPNSDLA